MLLPSRERPPEGFVLKTTLGMPLKDREVRLPSAVQKETHRETPVGLSIRPSTCLFFRDLSIKLLETGRRTLSVKRAERRFIDEKETPGARRREGRLEGGAKRPFAHIAIATARKGRPVVSLDQRVGPLSLHPAVPSISLQGPAASPPASQDPQRPSGPSGGPRAPHQMIRPPSFCGAPLHQLTGAPSKLLLETAEAYAKALNIPSTRRREQRAL